MDFSDKEQVEELVEGCISRNTKYQKLLYKHMYGKMMAICYRYARRPEDAHDLFQEGFIKVFEKIERFNFNGSLEGWVRRIMVNNAIDHYRKNKNKFAISETSIEETDIADENEGENMFEGVGVKQLLQYVQELSPVYRTVFSLYVMDDYSHAEIADELGISEGTSKSNLSKAKKNLKKMILEQLRNEK
ncbi:MAG: RNA polymerase subunit sigma-70 [Verrucomicrobia bacterium]|nr:RNA polymerase subunit sigma-70 [Verrucomicrobiota bacterium]